MHMLESELGYLILLVMVQVFWIFVACGIILATVRITKCIRSKKSIDTDPYYLKEQMVKYEDDTVSQIRIPDNDAFVIRIDRECSKGLIRQVKNYAKKYETSPYSSAINITMVRTAIDLQKLFESSAVYINSSELILFFEPKQTYSKDVTYGKHKCNGIITRLISKTTSAATESFNRHFPNVFNSVYPDCDCHDEITSETGFYFQSSIVSATTDTLIKLSQYLVWRAVGTNQTSYKNIFAAYYLGSDIAAKMSISEYGEELRLRGLNYDSVPNINRYGLFYRNDDIFAVPDLRVSEKFINFLFGARMKTVKNDFTFIKSKSDSDMVESKFKKCDIIVADSDDSCSTSEHKSSCLTPTKRKTNFDDTLLTPDEVSILGGNLPAELEKN